MGVDVMDDTEPGSLAGSGAAPQPAPDASPWPESAAHWLEALPQGSVKIGRFTVLERLAAGGMGVVYAAYDSELDRKVAIKLLHEERASGTVRTRIVREARAMAKLSHPHVAQVFEVGEYLGSTFIAMEFVQGVTLRQWQQQERRSWREVLAVYLQAGRGLAAAHAEGLVHRDFKPDNAMIGRDGRVRVLDFGLVRAEEREAAREDEGARAPSEPEGDALATPLTKTGSMLGTPAYMAPEQLLGIGVDHRTDQFGFCVALWEGLHGERPFTGRTRAEPVANIIAGRTGQEPKGSEVPAWVKAVLVRGLEAELSRRFASMHGLLAALEADPTRRNRRLLAVAVGVSAVVLGVGGYAMDRARRVQACADLAASITEVWGDDAARARVQASLLGTGASFAPSTWARVEPKLDEYAAAWSEARESTCLAAEVEGTRTEELATRTTDCLTEHRDALASLVEVLADADATVVHGAASAAARLASLVECTDDARLVRRMQPPPDPQVRERVAEIRQRLAKATSLGGAGRFGEGLALARELTLEAETVGWAPLHAEVLWRVGHLAQKAGELELAEQALEQAVDLALREGDDAVATMAAGSLAYTTGSILGRHERGIWWAHLGLALTVRLGIDVEVRTADLYQPLASIHAEMGAYAEAGRLLEQVVAIREQALGPDHPNVAYALSALARNRFQMGATAEAKALYERAWAISEATLGPDHPDTAVPLVNLGSIHASTGAFVEAKGFFERALAIQEPALGPDHLHVVNTRDGLGRAHVNLGEYVEAKALFERELAIKERTFGPDHAQVGFVLINLAWVHAEMGALATAMTLGERSLAIHEKALGPDHPDVASALSDLAETHMRMGAHAEAKVLFQRALAVGEKALGPDHHFIAFPLTGLAAAAVALGAPEEAIAPAERALRILEAVAVEPHRRASTRFTLAKALWASGRDRERALALARQGAAEATNPKQREELEEWLRGAEAEDR